MKLKDIIQEAISPIVYHDRSLRSIADIAKNDRFLLSTAFRRSESRFVNRRQKVYYMSVARSKTNAYRNMSYYVMNQTTLVLDGIKLSQRYHGKAVDFFADDEYEYQDEMEDRIFSDKPVIPKAHRYIKEIHILMERKDDKDLVRLNIVAEYAKKYRIPLFIYNGLDSKNNFYNLNKRNTITYEEFVNDKTIDTNNLENKKKENEYRKLTNTLITRDPKRYKLSDEEKKLIRTMYNAYKEGYLGELLDINFPNEDDLAFNLPRFMRQHGIHRDIREVYKKLIDKWRDYI